MDNDKTNVGYNSEEFVSNLTNNPKRKIPTFYKLADEETCNRYRGQAKNYTAHHKIRADHIPKFPRNNAPYCKPQNLIAISISFIINEINKYLKIYSFVLSSKANRKYVSDMQMHCHERKKEWDSLEKIL